ncbi:poly adp-ribose polymerase [Grosmannia clavigera kw1407]|uniref:Poly [ADP-ribose] polymerase n=1 Tax=Grosmannia clavigera (strain kw1407 / UAMH 11150) TaxID=655863 RepID=F0XNU1_GROCL|nr:poly adp-ribose polymerase [Grosmannia clavigera kw1407]EFX00136.1 poly adp-ribose polymerase [Grosmannia clavigera kw1407]
MLGNGSLDDALKKFQQKFKDKSGLRWEDRCEDPKPGKYAFVEKNYQEDSDEDMEPDGRDIQVVDDYEPPPCSLPEAVRGLMDLIFNRQFFAATMTALNYDANKLPLGKLSKTTISRGFQALKDLSALLDDPDLAGSLYNEALPLAIQNLSNLYYSVIPHAFGRFRPPIINGYALLKKEVELLESLSDMKDAELLMKVEKAKQKPNVHPTDKLYQELGMKEMTTLDHGSTEFHELANYLFSSRGSTHSIEYEVEEIFRIERQDEKLRFDASVVSGSTKNKRLLWHGSRVTNFAGILNQGLRIAPPEAPVSGYMFGKGIYLADMSSKSANYCCSGAFGGTALLLLCEADLGNPVQELINASYTAGDDAKAKGLFSTLGQGQIGPLAWKDAGCIHEDLTGVKMPDVAISPGPTGHPNAHLLYNEYIVYDVSQIRLRYLFRVRI